METVVHCSMPQTAPPAALHYAFSEHTCLRLAAAGCSSIGGTVGRSSCSNTVSGTTTSDGKTPAGFTNSRHLLILHLHQRAGSPAAALGHRLLVRGEVEGEEEEEVRRDDADARNSRKLLAGALAHVGDVWPVSASEVGPRGKVDEAWNLLAPVTYRKSIGGENLPRSRTNCVIWPTVMYFFHQMRMPRALWK